LENRRGKVPIIGTFQLFTLEQLASTRSTLKSKQHSKTGTLQPNAAARRGQRGVAAAIGHALDRFAGTWSAKRLRDFRKAAADLDRIDEARWQ
jgi:hypothetical protein